MYKVDGVYYDREQFPRFFDSVANPTDWRAEISAWIKPEDYSLINEAVRYYTGTSLEIKEKCKTDHPAARVGHTMLVYSIGYRNGPCGP